MCVIDSITLILRGRLFDPGGGGLANLIGTDYLFTPAWPENLFSGKRKTEYSFIHFQPQQLFEKQKKRGGGA